MIASTGTLDPYPMGTESYIVTFTVTRSGSYSVRMEALDILRKKVPRLVSKLSKLLSQSQLEYIITASDRQLKYLIASVLPKVINLGVQPYNRWGKLQWSWITFLVRTLRCRSPT